MPVQTATPDVAAIDNPSVPQSGITGTITDQAGVVIPGATVKLRPLTSPASRSLTSDRGGQFNAAGLEPGRYELQVSAPGFKRTTKQIDVQPAQMARADSTLSVGSVSESISVTAEVAQIQTATKDHSAVQPLPSKLRAGTTVVKGKLMLRTDSSGALYLSKNAGEKWTVVKPVWQGKVVSLTALAAPVSSPGPAFQLTIDSGAVWLSRDGSHWYAAPAQK
jgi:hypothetical protein